MEEVRVFVYGTLRYGERANRVLGENARLVSKNISLSGYRLHTHGPYPFALVSSKDDTIYGDLYEIDSERLDILDRYEGIDDGLYQRVFNKTINAYLYITDDESKQNLFYIESGDWIKYRLERKLT